VRITTLGPRAWRIACNRRTETVAVADDATADDAKAAARAAIQALTGLTEARP
jgi:hypothetical protein